MTEVDYYAPGTYRDPNAPWNERDDTEIYGDRAEEIIINEIKDRDSRYIEFLIDSEYLPKKEINQGTLDLMIDALAEDDVITEQYCEYRMEDVVQQLSEEDYDDRPDPRDYCE